MIEAEIERACEPSIFNCALLDDLWSRALAGDERAVAILRAGGRKDAPPAVRRKYRTEQMCSIATWLHNALPALTPHAIAQMLTTAGDHLQRHRNLPVGGAFDELDSIEQRHLQNEIRKTIDHTRPLEWPCLRQMQRILEKGSDILPR